MYVCTTSFLPHWQHVDLSCIEFKKRYLRACLFFSISVFRQHNISHDCSTRRKDPVPHVSMTQEWGFIFRYDTRARALQQLFCEVRGSAPRPTVDITTYVTRGATSQEQRQEPHKRISQPKYTRHIGDCKYGTNNRPVRGTSITKCMRPNDSSAIKQRAYTSPGLHHATRRRCCEAKCRPPR